jgi:protein involved in polysaccharide export with SLBB domain
MPLPSRPHATSISSSNPTPSRRPVRASARLGAAALALALAAGCKTTNRLVPSVSAPEPPSQEAVLASATLGSGDVLEVRVYGESDLSGAFRVSPDGTIDYPFCGRVRAAGLSAGGLVDRLTECLRRGYLKSPQVTVFLKEYNSKKVFVFGEVQKPGTFPFEDRMSVIQAVTLAGGFTKTAAKNSVIVTRVIDNDERKIKVPVENIGEGREKNFALQPGDIVYVPESFL